MGGFGKKGGRAEAPMRSCRTPKISHVLPCRFAHRHSGQLDLRFHSIEVNGSLALRSN